MIGVSVTGNTNTTDDFLDRMMKLDVGSTLEAAAAEGVTALSSATPEDSGLTATSWYYEIETKGEYTTIWWCNRNIVNGFNVAVGLQYGHNTGTGGWVSGYDFINPALKPIFDKIADNVWKEVQKP